ncbi:MAG: pyrroloquinoline quinone precursor peptide PqqA [Hyphomicrobiales bacterium]|nr:pyrroloquinoline quinone precursor peptide PqqA [Hyphomicrobiales bacterium]MDE1974005.1 pyrroloquinoline quinone precursor peptide PqqA [Hyphomicrobiales bacterium]MDE2375024.1 pyrroloquinoline quinone precursor peptide PqqA [Hyphomicrobiales bacterium]
MSEVPSKTYFIGSAEAHPNRLRSPVCKGNAMAWTTPTLVEICIGLEINGYLPAEF